LVKQAGHGVVAIIVLIFPTHEIPAAGFSHRVHYLINRLPLMVDLTCTSAFSLASLIFGAHRSMVGFYFILSWRSWAYSCL